MRGEDRRHLAMWSCARLAELDPADHPLRAIREMAAQAFFAAVVAQAREGELPSDGRFSVDGTLIEAWAGQKSFRPTDGSGERGAAERARDGPRRVSRGPPAPVRGSGPFTRTARTRRSSAAS
ncbi:MAG: hypothetical protein FJ028_04000 [Chloroflexi bacterium]|nr:hypothetical protein [Chloroflexota bacterium]